MMTNRSEPSAAHGAQPARASANRDSLGCRLAEWTARLASDPFVPTPPAGRRARSAAGLGAGAAPRIRFGDPQTADAGQTELWQRRQMELLERIDENLKRLRELHESPLDRLAVFTDPAN